MARGDEDEQGVPAGGKAAARLRQFLQARGLEGEQDEDEDGGQAGQDAETSEDPHRDDSG